MLEALVIALIATVGVCFAVELVLARPDVGAVRSGLIPTHRDHHQPARCCTSPSASSAPRSCRTTSICTRRSCRRASTPRHTGGKREAMRFASIDSTIALLLRVLHQRGDPDHRGGDVPHAAATPRSPTSGRLPAADAAAGRRAGQHAVRPRAAGVGPELHAHRHARRADRDGRVPEHSPAGRGCAA